MCAISFMTNREHVGGMNHVRRNSRESSDADAQTGHIVDLLDDIMQHTVQTVRQDTFGNRVCLIEIAVILRTKRHPPHTTL